MDIKAGFGEEVYAPEDCTAITFGRSHDEPYGVSGVKDGAWGQVVRFFLNDGRVLDYCHLADVLFYPQSGDPFPVSRGQVVGYVGTRGLSTGPHLHMHLWPSPHHCGNGANRIDPLQLPWDFPPSVH